MCTRRPVRERTKELIGVAERDPPTLSRIVNGRSSVDDSVLVLIQVESRVFRSDLALHSKIPVRSNSIGSAQGSGRGQFVVVGFGRLFTPTQFHSCVEIDDQRVIEKILLKDEIGSHDDLMFL